MTKKWLNALVRARQVQEDAAKQRLAGSQHASRRAAAQVRYDRDRLESLQEADAVAYAPAFVAAAVALQAAAATHAAALSASRAADEFVEQRRGELTDAARARRTAEQLHEQHVAELRARASAATLRELDEIAARVHRDGSTS